MSTANMPGDLRKKVWEVAGSVEWTEDDWRDFYESLTAVFARVAARHALVKIQESKETEKETSHA